MTYDGSRYYNYVHKSVCTRHFTYTVGLVWIFEEVEVIMEIRKYQKEMGYDLLELNTEEYLTLLWLISDLEEEMEQTKKKRGGLESWYKGYDVDTIRSLNETLSTAYYS